MKEKENKVSKSTYAYVSIVAIVAIVAMVVLFSGGKSVQNEPVVLQTGFSGDLIGEAVRRPLQEREQFNEKEQVFDLTVGHVNFFEPDFNEASLLEMKELYSSDQLKRPTNFNNVRVVNTDSRSKSCTVLTQSFFDNYNEDIIIHDNNNCIELQTDIIFNYRIGITGNMIFYGKNRKITSANNVHPDPALHLSSNSKVQDLTIVGASTAFELKDNSKAINVVSDKAYHMGFRTWHNSHVNNSKAIRTGYGNNLHGGWASIPIGFELHGSSTVRTSEAKDTFKYTGAGFKLTDNSKVFWSVSNNNAKGFVVTGQNALLKYSQVSKCNRDLSLSTGVYKTKGVIEEMQVNDCETGFLLLDNAHLKNSVVTNSKFGVLLGDSSSAEGIVSNNNRYGFYTTSANNAVIESSSTYSNSDYGFFLRGNTQVFSSSATKHNGYQKAGFVIKDNVKVISSASNQNYYGFVLDGANTEVDDSLAKLNVDGFHIKKGIVKDSLAQENNNIGFFVKNSDKTIPGNAVVEKSTSTRNNIGFKAEGPKAFVFNVHANHNFQSGIILIGNQQGTNTNYRPRLDTATVCYNSQNIHATWGIINGNIVSTQIGGTYIGDPTVQNCHDLTSGYCEWTNNHPKHFNCQTRWVTHPDGTQEPIGCKVDSHPYCYMGSDNKCYVDNNYCDTNVMGSCNLKAVFNNHNDVPYCRWRTDLVQQDPISHR